MALASERPEWQIVATDVSVKALDVARQNAQQLKISNVIFSQGSWLGALATPVNIILSNPPYIAANEWDAYAPNLRCEPFSALVSGPDGLDAIREIIHTAKSFLKPEGYLLLEHGFAQAAAVRSIFAADGYNDVHTFHDLSGKERLTIGQV